jgi:transcriptional regulator with XRE-family HTH domain
VVVRSVLARNVKRFRKDRALSMTSLAGQSGLSKQTIIAIEQGRGNPTVDTVERLADVLGVGVRALVSELGSEVLRQTESSARWVEANGTRIRSLDQAFGSGYVVNTVIELRSGHEPFRRPPGGRGTLRHCYVLDGTVRLGPETAAVVVSAGDFVRFPADTAHSFAALSDRALVHVCTTQPQLSMEENPRQF